jgi:hypothetical protein
MYENGVPVPDWTGEQGEAKGRIPRIMLPTLTVVDQPGASKARRLATGPPAWGRYSR